MIVQPIFQTPIFIENFKGLTDELGLEEYIKQCCYETPDTFNNVEFIQSRRDLQTVDHNLHQYWNHDLQKQEVMRPLCRKIYDMMHSIIEVYQYCTYHIKITSMWGNIQKPGTHFKRHSHYNNMFSGVFYLNENNGFPPIMFWRPEEQSIDPKKAEFNPFNQGSYFQETKKDTLIIFPAWLQHSVELNETDKDRINISFNVMLRGDYYNVEL